MLRNLAYILVLVTPSLCFDMWASGGDGVKLLDQKNLGTCKLSVQDGASVDSVAWKYGAGNDTEQRASQESIVSVWLSEKADFKTGAAQGAYAMYSVEHSFKDTLTLMSSQDWKVDTLPSVTFSYKNGVLFSLVQKSAFYSDRIDGKGPWFMQETQPAPASKSARGQLTMLGGCLSEKDSDTILDAATPCKFKLAIRELFVTLTKQVTTPPVLNCENNAVAAKATPGGEQNVWQFSEVVLSNVKES